MTRHTLQFFILLLALLIDATQSAQAQFNRLFTTEQDLPNTLVNKVREDANEMIWIATEDGLCRFDGSRVSTYRHEAGNPHSIQSDFIRTICTDADGHVLVATTAGVQLYRPSTDDFSPLIINPASGIEAGNVSDLRLLNNGDIFATGNTTFTLHFDAQGQPQAIRNAFTGRISGTYRVEQDDNDDIWVIKFNNGIYRQRYDTDSIETFSDVAFTCLGVGQDGQLYAAGQRTGIYKFSPATNAFNCITPDGCLFSAREFCQIPNSQQMCVATDGDGIFTLDCPTGRIAPFAFDDIRIDARSQKVHSVTFSRNGELWMAIYQKGVLVQVPNPLDFQYYGSRSIQYDCIGDRCVTTLLRTHDHRLWIGTDNGGIYSISDAGKTLQHVPVSPLPSALTTLFEDSQRRVWFGSYGQGGGIIDLATGRCQFMPIEGTDGSRTNINDFAEDNRGQIWVAAMGLGILRYDEERHCLVSYPTLDQANWCASMRYDKLKDQLYIGTYNGLVTIPLSGERRPQWNLENHVINSVTQCSDSCLSLSTNHGVVLYNPQTGRCQTFSTECGLPKGALYASEVDDEGNIWVSGTAGLSRLNVRQGTFTNYTVHDGLRTTEFYKKASMRDTDGTLWFGGTDGITRFRPSQIHPQAQTFDVRIVSLQSELNIIKSDDDGVYHISNDDHSFSIELATRPILLTHRVTYRYSMDGDSWQTLMPMMNSVSFSRIASGRHTFRFKAISGEQESEVQCVTIFIAYPWYRTWWAWLVWLAIGGLLILQLWQVRRDLVRRRQAKQDEAINEAKLQFFMNIAHEFRTPMTLIVGPLQKLIASDSDASRQRSYQLIDRNANRILNLINQMMDLRKLDEAQMTLHCRRLPLIPQVREQIELLSDMSESRKVRMSLVSSLPDGLTLWLDHDHFEKILLNLLSNALKYTPEGGYIEVACQRQPASEHYPEGSVTIAVTDSGIGIPKDERAHIFERFYQVRHGSLSQSIGTGIGLHLVHSLVKLHHGDIALADNPQGQGTQFVVTLPLGDSVYSAAERDEQASPSLRDVGNAMVTTASILSSTLRNETTSEADGHTKPSHHHLLIVEDDEEIRQYLSKELSPHYRISQCDDGQPAYDMLLKADNSTPPIDLVLTDLMLPVMDGLQLCQKIRNNVRLNHIPVILLTARTSDEDRLRSLKIGANAFVTKPFNMQLLQQTIRNIIDNQTRLRNTFSGQQVPTELVETPTLKSPDERLLERIIRVVNDNLSNPDLTSEFIAREVGLSRVHLYRKLKELTNQSARNYIRNIRLTKAAELLGQKKMSVSEVAYLVGFTSSNNFASAFKELYGMSPSEYMDQKAIKDDNARYNK